MAPMAMTLQEQFSRTFDVFPFEQPQPPSLMGTRESAFQGGAETAPRRSGSTTGATYGFGSASLRFQNEVYGSHLPYGKVNKAVIELSDTQPVDVTQMAATAPSRQLPEFAAKFRPPVGRTFAKTVSRDAPPAENGAPRYWVQPRDLGGLFPGQPGPPEPFPMEVPRGAAPPSKMHEGTGELLTPAERREALVFEKCHQRARKALRAAASEACQLTMAMQKRHPHGVLGVEGPSCPDSLIYAESRAASEAKMAAKAQSYARRHESIAARRDTQLDYRLLTHDHTNTATDALFQSKRGSSLGIRGDPTSADPANTYEFRPSGRIVPEGGFRSNQEKAIRAPNALRAASLHNASTHGKPYDIISGASLSVRPTAADAPDLGHDRRAHPSNFAMPRRLGTAPTLVGPIPDAHRPSWQPPSPTRSPSKQFLR